MTKQLCFIVSLLNIHIFKKINVERNIPSVMAIGMYSADGEYVKWCYAVHCTGAVENWFQNIGKYHLLIKTRFKL